MSPFKKGLLLAVVQVMLVASLGAKLLVDRWRLPRVWAQTMAYDPDLPIRGRYLSVRLRVQAERIYGSAALPDKDTHIFWGDRRSAYLTVENGQLTANPAPDLVGLPMIHRQGRPGEEIVCLSEPVAFFLPEHAVDPSRLKSGEELWVEVTLPKQGPPRPIRLGIKRDGKIIPLEIR